jgi:hypothetical protein
MGYDEESPPRVVKDPRYESLQLLIKEKSKENRGLQEQMAQVKADNQKMKTKLGASKAAGTGMAALENMSTNLQDALR